MIANRTFDRPLRRGGLEGSMALRADLRVKSLCQNSARIGRKVRICPQGKGEAGITCLGSNEKAWRNSDSISRSFETGLRETLTFERAFLEKSHQTGLLVFRAGRAAATPNAPASRVGARRVSERVRVGVEWRGSTSRCTRRLRGRSPG